MCKIVWIKSVVWPHLEKKVFKYAQTFTLSPMKKYIKKCFTIKNTSTLENKKTFDVKSGLADSIMSWEKVRLSTAGWGDFRTAFDLSLKTGSGTMVDCAFVAAAIAGAGKMQWWQITHTPFLSTSTTATRRPLRTDNNLSMPQSLEMTSGYPYIGHRSCDRLNNTERVADLSILFYLRGNNLQAWTGIYSQDYQN